MDRKRERGALASTTDRVRRSRTWKAGSDRMPRMRWRVVCALGVTMDSCCPSRAFISVLLPALGRPMIVTKPAGGGGREEAGRQGGGFGGQAGYMPPRCWSRPHGPPAFPALQAAPVCVCGLPARWPGGSGVKLEKSSRITGRLPLAAAASSSARSSSSACASDSCAASAVTSWPLGFFAWHLRRRLQHAAAALLPKLRASAAARRAGCTEAPAEGNMHSCIFGKVLSCRSKGFPRDALWKCYGWVSDCCRAVLLFGGVQVSSKQQASKASTSSCAHVGGQLFDFCNFPLAGLPEPQFGRGAECRRRPHATGWFCHSEPCSVSLQRAHLGRVLRP